MINRSLMSLYLLQTSSEYLSIVSTNELKERRYKGKTLIYYQFL